MTSRAWERAKFNPRVDQIREIVKIYDSGRVSPDFFTDIIHAWVKEVRPPAKKYDVALEAQLREEWDETGNIQLFQKYSNLDMNYRDMGRVCGVSASAISRWLNGERTKRV